MTKTETALEKKLTKALERCNNIIQEINDYLEQSGAGFHKEPVSREFRDKYGDGDRILICNLSGPFDNAYVKNWHGQTGDKRK